MFATKRFPANLFQWTPGWSVSLQPNTHSLQTLTVPGDPTGDKKQQDHQERNLLVSTAFWWDMQHLPARHVGDILVKSLAASYERGGVKVIWKFLVYTTGGEAHSLTVWAEPEPGRTNTYVLSAEESLLGC